jgi:hypothetical protein
LFLWLASDWGDGQASPTLCSKLTALDSFRHAINVQAQAKPTESRKQCDQLSFIFCVITPILL